MMPRIIAPSTPLFAAPDCASGRETDCLYGESVAIHNSKDGFHEVTLATDGYRGWLHGAAIGKDETPKSTHRVIAPRALITSGIDIKTPAVAMPQWLPMGALVVTGKEKDDMVEIALGDATGYIPARHLIPVDEVVSDWVAVAESLIGTPYRWGGRDTIGIDCSALVQLGLAAGGVQSPRNSGDQEKSLGVDVDGLDNLARGDLVFWRGHVGIMTDNKTLLHANMHHAMTATEPLRDTITRFEAKGLEVTRLVRVSI